jgi:flagellar biosynthesis/type III secretory pathway ATPase
VDAAVSLRPRILDFLQQTPQESTPTAETSEMLLDLAGAAESATRR